jgi:hypothetical protein
MSIPVRMACNQLHNRDSALCVSHFSFCYSGTITGKNSEFAAVSFAAAGWHLL